MTQPPMIKMRPQNSGGHNFDCFAQYDMSYEYSEITGLDQYSFICSNKKLVSNVYQPE